jgi:hypothetical protein
MNVQYFDLPLGQAEFQRADMGLLGSCKFFSSAITQMTKKGALIPICDQNEVWSWFS